MPIYGGWAYAQEMKPDIVSKLNAEFEQGITTERQEVVYLLVEARKLLENGQQLKRFPALSLCVDWAVHPALDRKPALAILNHFDVYEAEFRKSGVTMKEFDLKPLIEFLALSSFRKEFTAALREQGVDTAAIESDEHWRCFVLHYTGVIQDCPLQAVDASGRIVVAVTAQAWPLEMANNIFPGKRVVQWNWNPKDRDDQGLIGALV